MENKYKFTKKDLKILYRKLKLEAESSIKECGAAGDCGHLLEKLLDNDFSLKNIRGDECVHEMIMIPLEEIPLHINSIYRIDKQLIDWRLEIGK